MFFWWVLEYQQVCFEWNLHSNDKKKKKFLGCFALILLVDVKAFPLARILLESENDLEEEFTFMLCGHATLIHAERIFSVNKVAPLSFKCKPS